MKARSSASSPSFASSETGLSVASCITLRCAINDRCINMHSAAARRNLVRRRSFPCRLNSRARDTRPWRCIHRMHLNQELVCILDAWRAINRRSPTTGAQRLIRRIAASASGESREHHKIPNSQVRIQNERLMRLGLGKKKKRKKHASFFSRRNAKHLRLDLNFDKNVQGNLLFSWTKRMRTRPSDA